MSILQRWIGLVGDRIGRKLAEQVAVRLPDDWQGVTVERLASAVDEGVRRANQPSSRFRKWWKVVCVFWIFAILGGSYCRKSASADVTIDQFGSSFSLELEVADPRDDKENPGFLTFRVGTLISDFASRQPLDIALPISAQRCEQLRERLGDQAICETSKGPLTGVNLVHFKAAASDELEASDSELELSVSVQLVGVSALQLTLRTFGLRGIEGVTPVLRLQPVRPATEIEIGSPGREPTRLAIDDPRDPPLVVRIGDPNNPQETSLTAEDLTAVELISSRFTRITVTDGGGTAWIGNFSTPLPLTGVRARAADPPLQLSMLYSSDDPVMDLKARASKTTEVFVGKSNLVPSLLEHFGIVATIFLGALGAGLFATIPYRYSAPSPGCDHVE